MFVVEYVEFILIFSKVFGVLDFGYMGVEGVKMMVYVFVNGVKLLDLVMFKGRMRSDFNIKILDEYVDILRLS